MRQILVYADSLTWGIIPDTRRRLPFEGRWPGVMEAELLASGTSVRVIEDCLNGRRTVFEDPYKPGRNGLIGLQQRIEINSPLDLVILMLGTNDFQSMHPHNVWHSAQGVGTLVDAVRQAPIEPGMAVPGILAAAPAAVAQERRCAFFDAGQVTGSSVVDGIHLDADQHLVLGRAIAGAVGPLLADPFQSHQPARPAAVDLNRDAADVRRGG